MSEAEGVAKRAKTLPVGNGDEKVTIYKTGMRRVDIPRDVTKMVCDPSVTEVDRNAFRDCYKLKEVVFNEGLQVIRWCAFEGCNSLTSIKLPSTVTKIGACAFEYCNKLMEVVLNEGLREIGNYAFGVCNSITSIKLPSTVTELGDWAFQDCSNLTEVVLNEGLQEIGGNTFDGCSSLENVKLFFNISNRVKNLIEAGQSEILDKIDNLQRLEWDGDALSVSAEAIREGSWCGEHWAVTKGHLDHVRSWILYYELKEATTIFELAMWKAKIGEARAVTIYQRNSCRVEVPGPAKDVILQYLRHGEDEENTEEGDDNEGSSSSSDYASSSDEDEEE